MLRKDALNILGTGKAHPKTVIDNAFLEELDIGTSNDWIMDRVGIATRRSVLPLDYIRETRNASPCAAPAAADITQTALGAEAARKALASAGIEPEQVGLLVLGTSIPQMSIPANGCLIANEIGVQAPTFDLNSACSSFSAHLHFINSMQRDKLPDYILLVQSETYTLSLNYSDRNSAVLFGDGASAQVLSARHPGKARILDTIFESDPSSWDKVYAPSHGHFCQEGNAVQRFAIQKTVSTAKKLLKDEEIGPHTYFIGHQANLRMLESSASRIGIAPSNHFYNVNVKGNCGAAGAPSVLAEHWKHFKPGDRLIIVTVGSGLSWGGSSIIFEGKT